MCYVLHDEKLIHIEDFTYEKFKSFMGGQRFLDEFFDRN